MMLACWGNFRVRSCCKLKDSFGIKAAASGGIGAIASSEDAMTFSMSMGSFMVNNSQEIFVLASLRGIVEQCTDRVSHVIGN
jgi:hypothetical protein